MTEITFKNNALTYYAPESWNEMTAEQTRFVFELFSKYQQGVVSYERFSIELLRHFVPFDRDAKTDIDVAELLVSLSESLFGFVLTKSEVAVSLNYDGVVQLFPILEHDGKNYSAPQALLWGMSFGQFLECMAAVRMLSSSHDDAHLDVLVRKIYGIKDTKPLSMTTLDKAILYHWFSSSLRYIQNHPIEIDGFEVNFSPLFNGGKVVTDPKIDGWTSIYLNVSEAGLFGTSTDVKEVDLFEVLLYLLKIHYDVKAQRT